MTVTQKLPPNPIVTIHCCVCLPKQQHAATWMIVTDYKPYCVCDEHKQSFETHGPAMLTKRDRPARKAT